MLASQEGIRSALRGGRYRMGKGVEGNVPDSSTISTCVASSESMSFELRLSGVTPEFGGSVIFQDSFEGYATGKRVMIRI
jgi:hypothetical protein